LHRLWVRWKVAWQSGGRHVSEIEPSQGSTPRVLAVSDSHPVRERFSESWVSLLGVLFRGDLVPFLVFFMLAGKRQVWHATMQMFPASERN